jgi:ABC-type branched-subunit amino acid transport system substrate-binding protein
MPVDRSELRDRRDASTRRFLAASCALVLLALVAFASSASRASRVASAQETKAATAQTARTLNTQERRGRAIYLRGESPSGREITATVGELDVPSSTVTCAGCHGARAEGKTEGGVTAGDLTWANLTKPYGHTHPTGRKHGPFTEAFFTRSLTEGIDPAGNTMLAAMPRFRMSPEDVADLLAYLKGIEYDRDPGLSETAVRVGTLVPSKGALAEVGAAMRDVLTAFFDDLNSRGGIYNRKVELRVAETGGDAAATADAARRLINDGQAFALVGGLSAGADKELVALTQELEVPFVGPSTLLPQAGTGANRYTFYLLPGAREQAQALVNFEAQRRPLKESRVSVVYTNGDVPEAAEAAVEEQCKRAACGAFRKLSFERAKFDARTTVQTLKGADAVFFFGSGAGEETAFINEAEAAGWRPDIFLLGVLAGRDVAASVPVGFEGRVFLAFPTIPTDLTPAGRAELSALVEKYKFPARHVAAQLSALAAAKILTEALQRGGKDLSREKLVTSLEGLYDFETGLTPRITFGPNRRVGAAGAYIITVDTKQKQFVPTGEWVKSN